MASVLRIGVRTTVGIFERATLCATSPYLGTATTVNSFHTLCIERETVPAAVTLAGAAQRRHFAASGRAGPLGRTSPAPQQRLQRRPAEAQEESESESDSDSDSEGKPRRERGTTNFWRRKIRSFHNLIDLNNDGVVSFEDFTILGDRFINLGHLTPKQQEEFREALKVVWEDQWGTVHPYNLVTTEQYLDNMHHIINDKELSRKAYRFLPHLFEALDKDKDGLIRVTEFIIFFKCLGRSEKDAIHSYRIIDINGDGVLSLKEFVRLGREYFTSDDEKHPSTHFWGPLISP